MKKKKKDRPIIIENIESFFIDDVLDQVRDRLKAQKGEEYGKKARR